MSEPLLGFLTVLWFGACFLIGIFNFSMCVWEMEHYNNSLLKCVFLAQRSIWNNYENELNVAGLILIELVATAVLLPSNLFLVIVGVFMWAGRGFWNFFKWVFRKRNGGSE